MSSIEDFIEAIKKVVDVPVQVITAVVTRVDLDNYTVDVLPDGSKAKLLDVRLKSAIDGVLDGLVEIPALDSTVLVGYINNDLDNGFVIKCSKVSKIIINGGKLGGLVIVQKLVDRLNDLEQKYNDLLNSCKTQSVVLAPSGTFPMASFFASNQPITNITKVEDLENDKVIH